MCDHHGQPVDDWLPQSLHNLMTILESIGTEQNDARLNEAEEHVIELEGQAGEFGSILTGAKEPAARSLQAAQAYDNIAKAMAEAEERAEEARNDAEASLS